GDVPVSVEWTAPYEETIFHIGVHNLPPARATSWMTAFAEYTAKPDAAKLGEFLRGLNANPAVLVVLNHPYWDSESIGPEAHRRSLQSFLATSQWLVQGLELNGMRSRRENREVIALGEAIGMPVISGGDRHGCEPNAALNLTHAATFDEFVCEVRERRRSDILLMPQFF